MERDNGLREFGDKERVAVDESLSHYKGMGRGNK